MVNEDLDYAKKVGRECLIFKVDSEKAYDLGQGVLGLFAREVWLLS